MSADGSYKLLIISDDHFQGEEIYSHISNIIPNHAHMQPDEVKREIVRAQADIVLLHESESGENHHLISYIVKEIPSTIVIYLTESKDPVRTRDVNRAGAFDILFLPDEVGGLVNVTNRAIRVLQARKEDPGRQTSAWSHGQIISLYSGKGGCGRSLTAATMAQTLGLDRDADVLLIDLNLQYGGIDTYLSLESEQSIYELTPVLNELNDSHIRSVTTPEINSQVDVLISPADAEIAEMITDEHIHRLLREARLYYDFIIIDLPTEMTTLTFAALEESDRIHYMMTPDSPSVRILGRVLELFTKLGSDSAGRMEILINRLDKNSELSASDIKQHFNFPIIGELREDVKKVSYSINRGQPLRTSTTDRNLSLFARDIRKLVKKNFSIKTEKALTS